MYTDLLILMADAPRHADLCPIRAAQKTDDPPAPLP
jgi:hypothetical protein